MITCSGVPPLSPSQEWPLPCNVKESQITIQTKSLGHRYSPTARADIAQRSCWWGVLPHLLARLPGSIDAARPDRAIPYAAGRTAPSRSRIAQGNPLTRRSPQRIVNKRNGVPRSATPEPPSFYSSPPKQFSSRLLGAGSPLDRSAVLQTQALPGAVSRPAAVHRDGLTVDEAAPGVC